MYIWYYNYSKETNLLPSYKKRQCTWCIGNMHFSKPCKLNVTTTSVIDIWLEVLQSTQFEKTCNKLSIWTQKGKLEHHAARTLVILVSSSNAFVIVKELSRKHEIYIPINFMIRMYYLYHIVYINMHVRWWTYTIFFTWVIN